MFEVLPTNLSNKTILTTPIDWSSDQFFDCQLTQFDREGYELLPIEQEYYKAEGLMLHREDVLAHESGQQGGWHAISYNWIKQKEKHPNLFLDHSLVVQRLGFGGEALKQLESYAKVRPELAKLINTKTKWGHDFCLDWIDKDGVTEIIHWEWDFRSFREYDIHREDMEKHITSINWLEYAKGVLNNFKLKDSQELTSEEIGDAKAKQIGLEKAFRLYKTL
jgi:hypothetical protein